MQQRLFDPVAEVVLVGGRLVGMGSDSESAGETPFTDCGATSGTGTDGGRRNRRTRQVSVLEMAARRAEGRKAKRTHRGRGAASPGQGTSSPPPGAVRSDAGPAGPVELSAASLQAIQQLVEATVAKTVSYFESKFEHLERKINVLEGETMEKDQVIKQLGEQLEKQTNISSELQKRVESLESNSRLSSLVLTCDEFEVRHQNEDIELRVVELLNRRFDNLHLSTADIQAAHRLQRDSKVIVRFMKRRVRDTIYERRFELARRGERGGGTSSQKSLYINESLSPTNRAIYNELLEARKASNGARVASVFSRRGVVFCRREKGGANIMVADAAGLRRVLGGGPGPVTSPGRAGRSPVAPGGSAALAMRGPAASAADEEGTTLATSSSTPGAAGRSTPVVERVPVTPAAGEGQARAPPAGPLSGGGDGAPLAGAAEGAAHHRADAAAGGT